MQQLTRIASTMLTRAIESLARLDAAQAIAVTRANLERVEAFRAVLGRMAQRKATTLVLRSIECIGAHTRQSAENVMFIVKGTDVRHIGAQNLAQGFGK